jgi:hypothetical protein
MVLSRNVNNISKINIKGLRLVVEDHKRSYESTKGEEEIEVKGIDK